MPADPPSGARVTYTQQFRRCGKADCPACHSGKSGHGPYWYAYWREEGRVHTRYLGRQAPVGAEQESAPTSEGAVQTPRSPAPPDTLRVRTLGAFEVHRGADLIPADRWTRRQGGALFKCLLGAPGHRLHREQAIDLLWPDADPAVGAANLRVATHVLRTILDGPESTHVQTTDHRLTLVPAPGREAPADWLDADAFVRIGRQALADRDTATCRAALGLYAGEYLPDDLYEEWVVGRREELRLLHLAVLLHQAELYTEQGNTHGALRALRKVLEVDPCHEAAARAMVRLHAVGGRRTEAIRIYHRFAATLRRELDLEPEPETQALFQALQQQALPTPAAPTVERVLAGGGIGGSVAGARSPHTNLPSVLTNFVGRGEAVTELGRLLSRSKSGPRLLTLTGVGGCGKTRLALQVASGLPARYRDGVWLVELAGLGDPALVVSSVAAVVGPREKAVISPAEGSSALSALIAILRDKQLLVVLDNCEHLQTACADLAARFIDGCPGVRILATSREPLRVVGEVVWRVPPLACPDLPPADTANVGDLLRIEAVSLFTERARIGRPGFALTRDNALPVARICRCLDGIPLALELAAARLGAISVEGIAARLETSFRLLAGEATAGLPRQQTMRAAMDWSYALLTDPERTLFRRLSVFAGGWSLEAAQAVCADQDGPTLDNGQVVGPADEPASGIEPEELLDGLVRLVAKSLAVRDEVVPAGSVVRYRLLEPVRQYAAEALAASGETAVLQRRHWAWCLALAERAEPELRGTEQERWFAVLDREQDNLRTALGWSMRQSGANGEGLRLAAPLMWYWSTRGRQAEGRRWLEWALQVGSAAPPTLRAGALNQAGVLAWTQSDFVEAARLHEESLTLKRRLGDRRGIAGSLNNLALAILDMGDYDRALRLHEESLAIKRELADPVWIASSLTNMGLIARWLGNYERAMALYDEALAIRRTVSDTHGIITTLNNMGMVALKRGAYGYGHALYGEALALSGDLHYMRGRADALTGLGLVAHYQHDADDAITRLSESIGLAQEMGDPQRGAWYLEALAEVLGTQGQARHAAQLLGAADATRLSLRVRIPPADQAEHAQRVADIRGALPSAAFEAAWAAGSAMTLDAAIAGIREVGAPA